MNKKRMLLWSSALAILALVVQPGLAAAQNAVLYEVTENLQLKALRHGARFATAALMGTVDVGTSVCPDSLAATLGATKCSMTAVATDNLDVATGVGPVRVDFHVVIQDNNGVDGPELVILDGKLRGTVDLSPAVLGPDGSPQSGDEAAIGFLTGRWEAHGVVGGPLQGIRAHGTLSGTFRLPFVLPRALDPTQAPLYLLDPSTFPAAGSFVPVAGNEFSLGLPTVRLEITFVDGR